MKKTFLCALFALGATTIANAGGILTNTNQSVAFLRNPARDAAIGIDGVYNNPAGVALLKDGFHLGVNWQTAIQTRTVETTSPYLDHTLQATFENAPTKQYRGHATAPILPSVQAAYNKDKWSFQFNFAVNGGGGKCEFSKGLGSFENAVGGIATQLKALAPLGCGSMGYGVDNFMEGRQYYFGVTLGAAYKVVEQEDLKVSVYGGLRGLIGNSRYKAQIKDIQVATSEGLKTLSNYIDWANEKIGNKKAEVAAAKDYANNIINLTQPGYEAYMANPAMIEAGAQMQDPTALKVKEAYAGYMQAQAGLAAIAAGEPQLAAGEAGINALEPYRNGLDLVSDQNGFGVAPILSADIQYKNFNIAAKYEFRTRMSLKNSSNLVEATIPETKQFVDGTSVREDSPALLTLGLQYSPIDIVRINAGYHHYYDLSAKKFGDKQKLLSKGTNEYLGGVEVDATDRLILSCGAQITRYGLTDQYMSDISFVTDSWSFGFGASYQANPNVKIEAAYFKTFYENYKTAGTAGIVNDFTRTNDVIGVGLVVNL